MTPYREAAAPGTSDAPDTLECWLRDGDRKRWVRAVYVKLWMTLVVAFLLSPAGLPLSALAAMVGGLWAWSDVRQRKGSRVAFRVAEGRLYVDRGKSGGPVDLDLEELLDVRLDSKSASKNVTMARADGVNTVFGMGSSHNIDIDIARIELVTTRDDAILVDPEFISASLSSDAMRSIRLYLRAHGWLPESERRGI